MYTICRASPQPKTVANVSVVVPHKHTPAIRGWKTLQHKLKNCIHSPLPTRAWRGVLTILLSRSGNFSASRPRQTPSSSATRTPPPPTSSSIQATTRSGSSFTAPPRQSASSSSASPCMTRKRTTTKSVMTKRAAAPSPSRSKTSPSKRTRPRRKRAQPPSPNSLMRTRMPSCLPAWRRP